MKWTKDTDSGSADVRVSLDNDGVIRKVELIASLEADGGDGWLGRRWIDTIGAIGADEVSLMMREAREQGVSDARRVVQRFPSGRQLPIEYKTVHLGGAAGIIAVGRNLQAVAEVQSNVVATRLVREQEAWKLRDVETLYRVLFETNHEPVLILRADDLRIQQANPAAARLYGFGAGQDLLETLSSRDREPLRTMLSMVREQGRAPGIMVRMIADRTSWIVRASLAGQEPSAVFLLQLTRVVTSRRDSLKTGPDLLATLVDRLPVPLVIIDGDGVIHRANGAFLELTQTGNATVIGESLGVWLPGSGATLLSLMAYVLGERATPSFDTMLIGYQGLESKVKLVAVGDTDIQPTRFVLLFLGDDQPDFPLSPKDQLSIVLGNVAQQIGRIPLRALLRDTGEIIERYYIRDALDLANQNRSLAADMLGLSRQSLYVKLRRYGLDTEAETTPDG